MSRASRWCNGGPLGIPTRNPNLVTRAQRDVPAVQVAPAPEERVLALAPAAPSRRRTRAPRAEPPTHPSAPRRP
ncbi:hypothetical protein [Streptomyces sp. NPDC003480]